MKKSLAFWLVAIGLPLNLCLALQLPEEVRDPVCGMKLDPAKAKFTFEYKNKIYYFCSSDCLVQFKKDSEKFITPPSSEQGRKIPICCSWPAEIINEINIEKKETTFGLELTITTNNPETIKKLQEFTEKCLQDIKISPAKHHESKFSGQTGFCCLLHDQNYAIELIKLSHGLKLKLQKKN